MPAHATLQQSVQVGMVEQRSRQGTPARPVLHRMMFFCSIGAPAAAGRGAWPAARRLLGSTCAHANATRVLSSASQSYRRSNVTLTAGGRPGARSHRHRQPASTPEHVRGRRRRHVQLGDSICPCMSDASQSCLVLRPLRHATLHRRRTPAFRRKAHPHASMSHAFFSRSLESHTHTHTCTHTARPCASLDRASAVPSC